MKDKDKTKEQLITELAELRQRIAELETSKSGRDPIEEALEESEERYRSLVESTDDSVYLIDKDNRYLFANRKYLSRLGLLLDEVVGHKYEDFHSEDTSKEFFEKTGRIYETCESTCYEHQSHRDNRYFLRTLSPVIDSKPGAVHAVTVISKDITGRKEAEIELRQSYEKLRRTLDGTFNALAVVTESRDPFTAGHQRRMIELACAIAMELDLPEDKIDGVRVAGALHDIGKISVPIEILNKPGKLSEMEMNLIKTHSQAGFEILRMIDAPWPIDRIVQQHHERYNGSGYPEQLSGENILLEARIIGVADVIEAISSRRPYREASGTDKALNEISMNRGILYDPDVVDACLRVFSDKKFVFEVDEIED